MKDCVGSADGGTPSDQLGGGGSIPTSTLRRGEWWVNAIDLELASDLVRAWHYAKGGPNTATYLHGLFRRGGFMACDCMGFAWWIPPTRTAAEATYPEQWQGVLALSRLAVAPDAPKNAASYLLARSRRLIDRARWPCLVTYADTAQGHTGAIYRADNWEYRQLTSPERMYRRNGRMIARKAGGHTRTHAEMIEMGCEQYRSEGKHKFVHVSSRATP
jgi:hypothetical protein